MESPRKDGVTGQLKQDILELYRSNGNMAASCRLHALEPRQIRWHMANDPAFKAAVDEARQEICDKAEGHIVQWMGEQKNVIDRLAWLRAYRPGTWNPKQEYNVTHDVNVTARLAGKAREAIATTAEVVPLTQLNIGGLDRADKVKEMSTS